MEIEISTFISILTLIPQEKAKLTASNRHTDRFSKSGISIYNSEVPEKMGRRI